ncbi:DUF1858 domain-containing protein [Chelativorans alearense]|uniref:DUF1858 domain-containing protein n=1 Tax=Chelativorans alearense TaxID=2681495 RepID=UPI001FEA3234|nr:DUF1858 domain-containing protein [Chelativorans alearense]
MRKPRLNPDMSLEEIMAVWPAAVAVFLRHRMLCVGCPITAFHAVTDACREHGVDEDAFMKELQTVIASA